MNNIYGGADGYLLNAGVSIADQLVLGAATMRGISADVPAQRMGNSGVGDIGLVVPALGGIIGGAGGPTIRFGAGAPAGTQPNGSLWVRNDGTTGARLYVSAGGGTWNAVAGV